MKERAVTGIDLGAIQKIRDTLGGGGVGTGQCHQMSHGGGREFAKVSLNIFSKFLSYIFVF